MNIEKEEKIKNYDEFIELVGETKSFTKAYELQLEKEKNEEMQKIEGEN